MEKALEDYKHVYINPNADKLMHNGAKIYSYYFDKKSDFINPGETVIAFDSTSKLNGIYKTEFDDEKRCILIRPITILF